jgi:MFS transporter, UMF1 family
MLKKNDPKILNAWCMYDWANSVHNLVIITAIFPMYFLATTKGEDGLGMVNFFGFSIKNSTLYAYAVSAGSLALVVLNPILTSLADLSGRRKIFMKFFCYLGSLSCAYLFFFSKGNISWSVVAFSISLIGWGGSVVFYNSFLPEIASEDRMDRVSARGFAFGYVGSILLLVFNLMMIQKPEWFGLTQADTQSGYTARIAFLTVGIWWALFAQIPFYFLPKDSTQSFQRSKAFEGYSDLLKIVKDLKFKPLIAKFLAAYFVYYMGVMTVIYVATIFAKEELNIPQTGLIITLLLIQIVAIPGSYLASILSEKFGNTIALRIEIFVWMLVPIFAYFTTKDTQFYVIAGLVGLVMGGVQSLSRSTYAKLLPDNSEDNAKYFGMYDILEKMATSLGTFLFGFVAQQTGSLRSSLLFLIVVFVIGFLLLMRIPSKKIYN